MNEPKILDHLFRHQYGKMVSILTRIFGLAHLPLIEDAVQDTFIKAMKTWRDQLPENPEAWLTAAAKNRMIDLFRQRQSEGERIDLLEFSELNDTENHVYLENEIADSQLRMGFAACNPVLKPQDQIAFALKTISGFSAKEIASALLLKEETVKKRLVRARKVISSENIAFEIPQGEALTLRLQRVLEVVYLIFNEGFHSGRSDVLVREDLCGEAMRLSKLLLSNTSTAAGDTQALFALFCFHASRLKSKIGDNNEVLSLKDQDRAKWHAPLIELGYRYMSQAVDSPFGLYHYEAAIAAEHVMAKSYDQTNWQQILKWYAAIYTVNPSAFVKLNMATVQLQLKAFHEAELLLAELEVDELEQRKYLYFGLWAEFHFLKEEKTRALENIEMALDLVTNTSEQGFLLRKKKKIEEMN
jgi:RNA polymerase sigma factor (sigma-70 family)